MAAPERRPMAVLVDAENVPASALKAILDDLTLHGDAQVKRVYGDWGSGHMNDWRKASQVNAFVAVQQAHAVSGKNSADIAMVIDAMELLREGRMGVFAMVSSDSDYSRLILHLKEKGKAVLGVGQSKAAESLVKACTQFIFIENLSPPPAPSAPKTSKKPVTPVPVTAPAAAAGWEPSALPAHLVKAVQECIDGERALLSAVGTRLAAKNPAWDLRSYGATRLLDLMARHADLFELSKEAMPNGPPRDIVKLRPAAVPPT